MASRVLLAAGAALLATSLFTPFFPGVSGWEHWAWTDVVFAVLAGALAAAATIRPRAATHLPLAALCGLGISVVLGHGFEPDVDTGDAVLEVGAGAYVALAGLAAGAVGALAPWPRAGGAAVLIASAAGIVAALLSGWGSDGPIVVFGSVDRVVSDYPNGFARWRVLDLALLALAAGLLVAATGRAPRVLLAAGAVGAVAAATCVLIGSRPQLRVDEGLAEGAATGTIAAVLALAGAVAGLALAGLRPRGRAARDG